jgi:hypothetical protein
MSTDTAFGLPLMLTTKYLVLGALIWYGPQ